MNAITMTSPGAPRDPFGRAVTYLRVSVTDRCDLRCVYCMAPGTRFAPAADLLTMAEIARLADAFIRLGARRIRVTGGEPLGRRGVLDLLADLGARLGGGLDELTLTTNGTRLARHAEVIARAGVRRINVSLDTLDPDRYARITHGGRLGPVLDGIAAARAAGLAIRINAVALRGLNEDAFDLLIAWCGDIGADLCLIEAMPLGEVAHRAEHYLPLSSVRRDLAARWTVTESAHRTAGPARYATIAETGRRIGFIAPMTGNFCDGCDRVRLTCTGQLVLCLGREDAADLRAVLRGGADDAALDDAIRAAIGHKPRGHDFVMDAAGTPALSRPMSATGG